MYSATSSFDVYEPASLIFSEAAVVEVVKAEAVVCVCFVLAVFDSELLLKAVVCVSADVSDKPAVEITVCSDETEAVLLLRGSLVSAIASENSGWF